MRASGLTEPWSQVQLIGRNRRSAFKSHHDAKRVMEVLGKRLGRFGLALHPDKTRFIDFRPERQRGTPADCKAPPFDFLGFTHTWAKSQKGKNVVRQ